MQNMTKENLFLDEYDKRIIRLLDMNARTPASIVSKKIKLPKETVTFRIKRLIKNKTITGFYTIINASKIGFQYYRIFISFGKITDNIEKEICSFILKQNTCTNLRIIEGNYDICFMTMHKNPEELKKLLTEFNQLFGKYIVSRSINIVIKTHRFNKIRSDDIEDKKETFNQAKPENQILSQKERKIIEELSLNARRPITEIARNIGLDPKVVKYHMTKLENSGIIVGYFCSLNTNQLKYQLIQMDISIINSGKIHEMIEFFKSTNNCLFVYEILGKYDLGVEFYIDDDRKLRKIISDFKKKFIEDYISYEISKIYKERVISWSPFDSQTVNTHTTTNS